MLLLHFSDMPRQPDDVRSRGRDRIGSPRHFPSELLTNIDIKYQHQAFDKGATCEVESNLLFMPVAAVGNITVFK